MRLLLLSDIHGNLDALEACLAAAGQFDRVANLGDAVGYGANPNEVIEQLRALHPISVRGNHDRACCEPTVLSGFNNAAALAAEWTYRELSAVNRAWLQGLPRGPVPVPGATDMQIVHGSPLDEDLYIASLTSAEAVLQDSSVALTFFGHTHRQEAYALQQSKAVAAILVPIESTPQMQLSRLSLLPQTTYLVNPGSVGQPRDGNRRAAFALYDDSRPEILFYRVRYNIAASQHKILAAGLPASLATRLEDGR